MKLSSLMQEGRILVHPEAGRFIDVVRQTLDLLAEELGDEDLDAMADWIVEAETEEPQLVGEHVCVPHFRMSNLKNFCLAVALLDKPVAHPSREGAELRVVFLLLAPRQKNALMVQAVAAISRRLVNKGLVSAIQNLRSAGRFIRHVDESGVDVKHNVTARTVMEPVPEGVMLDTPVDEAVDALARARDEGLPVFDAGGRLVGEITTREVLLLGMPKYMDLLSDPEMLNEFEPFETYFSGEHEVKVRDICRRDVVVVPSDSPIVGVAHQMITKNKRRIYVQDEERLDGIIYRKSILMQVMNASPLYLPRGEAAEARESG